MSAAKRIMAPRGGVVVCLALFFIGVYASLAQAEIAVMAGGKILYIDRFTRQDERVTLFITGGGEVTIPTDLVVNIVPNEIVDEGKSPTEVKLLPHWEAIIRPAADKYRLDPNLVAAVIWTESSGDPNAVSKKGAQGLMQLMPETARELGVQRVLDPAENVEGGSRYLRRMLDAHDGDLSLALAAYNAGPTAVARYGGIPPYPETQSYVNKVLRLFEEAGS